MRLKESAKQASREEVLFWLFVLGSWFPLRMLVMVWDTRRAVRAMRDKLRRRAVPVAPAVRAESV